MNHFYIGTPQKGTGSQYLFLTYNTENSRLHHILESHVSISHGESHEVIGNTQETTISQDITISHGETSRCQASSTVFGWGNGQEYIFDKGRMDGKHTPQPSKRKACKTQIGE